MTIDPLTKKKRIDTDKWEMLCDLDPDYVYDENDVWSALMGAVHESESILDISKIKDRKDLISKRYVSVDVLRKSFPILFRKGGCNGIE